MSFFAANMAEMKVLSHESQSLQGDLRDPEIVKNVVDDIEEVYQLAADMGGAGYIFTGEHDSVVMHNSATINLNMLCNMIGQTPRVAHPPLNPYRTNSKTVCTANRANHECPAWAKYATISAVLDQNLPVAHNVTIGCE